ncbi:MULTISPECIES: hypothetical protein [unclassified Parafrankia]|uniref:hypothetical protein n=1 Tax=unclassified Parafrankia TaxID=2994368 RepID=UPI000DA4CFD6|nr:MULTISPECIES: hypothetical protein [unclassified Parafrankia]CAI7980581.1 hypothetical protein FRAHR75_840006 [Frankia sp. Hr75.2]SQD97484.1 hypothetical protein FMEAI12_4130006 [Parafrankia sp. Ea1.12]
MAGAASRGHPLGGFAGGALRFIIGGTAVAVFAHPARFVLLAVTLARSRHWTTVTP